MKLFRSLRQKLLREGRISRYVFYALGEILLVMVGILLAFQVDRWNDNRLNRVEELKYYTNLKGQLEQQRLNILGQINFNGWHLKIFDNALKNSLSGDRSRLDTLVAITPYLFNYSDYDQTGNLYETLVNSGDIKFVNNEDIISKVRGMEYRYQYINRMENIHWDIILQHVAAWVTDKIDFTKPEAIDPQNMYSYEFQNILLLLQRVMEEKEVIYKAAVEEIDLLNREIDAEIDQGR